jgi:hypothetical protein
MVAALVPGNPRAFEPRQAAPQQRHAGIVQVMRETVEGLTHASEALAQLHLLCAQNMNREMLAAGEGGKTLRMPADRPEHDRRVEGHRCKAVRGDADGTLGRHRGDDGDTGRKPAERVAELALAVGAGHETFHRLLLGVEEVVHQATSWPRGAVQGSSRYIRSSIIAAPRFQAESSG